MGLNLGQDWEFQPDAPNNRLFAEYGPTGSSVSFGEDGDLTLDDGNLDLSGGSLTDSSQDYVDLSGGGNDLRLATGQAIEDGSGTKRIEFLGGRTEIFNEDGDSSLLMARGFHNRLSAYSDTPLQVFDKEGGFPAVQYDTDPSAGVLRTPNARIDLEEHNLEGVASIVSDDEQNNLTFSDPTDGPIFRINKPQSADTAYDMSLMSANLRLGTGQAIEDGGGNERIVFRSTDTVFSTDSGTGSIILSNGKTRIFARSGQPIIFEDEEGTFDAVQYRTSASSPGTLELTNANLDGGGNDITNVGSVNTDALSHNIADNNDVTASRSFDTEFQNTTGKNIAVIVRLGVSAAGDEFRAALEVGDSSGLSFSANIADFVRETSNISSAERVISAVVPDAGYYQVETFGGNISTITRWYERRYQ